MLSFETGLEIAKLATAFLGAIGVAWYWNWKKHVLERYRYIDETYHTLLQLYLEHPHFGDAARTATYKQSFAGDAALQYHYFAMRVHTTMESLFDLSHGNISPEWKPIFEYHTALHSEWLGDNARAHEAPYVARVLGAEPHGRDGAGD